MYARFYRAKRRLVAQLVDSHKIAGQARAEHIAPLGSVLLPEPFSLSERTKFWEALEGRLRVVVDRIGGGRFTDEVRAKVLAAIDRRIPKPGEAEEISAAVAAARAAAEKRGPSTGSGRGGRRAASDTPSRRGVDA